jgi:hypothetical protein
VDLQHAEPYTSVEQSRCDEVAIASLQNFGNELRESKLDLTFRELSASKILICFRSAFDAISAFFGEKAASAFAAKDSSISSSSRERLT